MRGCQLCDVKVYLVPGTGILYWSHLKVINVDDGVKYSTSYVFFCVDPPFVLLVSSANIHAKGLI